MVLTMSDTEEESPPPTPRQVINTSFGTVYTANPDNKITPVEIVRRTPLPPIENTVNELGGIQIDRTELGTYYQIREQTIKKEKEKKREENERKQREKKVNKGISPYKIEQDRRNRENANKVKEKIGLLTSNKEQSKEEIREARLKKLGL